MLNQDSNPVYYGGFFARLAAFCIDTILVGIVLLFVHIPALFLGGSPLYQPVLFQFSILDIVVYLLGKVYFVLLTYATGSTLGKRALSLRVVAADEEKLSFWNVLYRETIGKYLSAAVLHLGYLMAGIDGEKRALHDMLADTRVVYIFHKEKQPEPVNNYYAADYSYPKTENVTTASEEVQEDEPTNVNATDSDEEDN